MRHFAAPKPQGDLALVAIFQKLEHRAHLDLVVMGIGVGAELDLFDLDDLLILAGVRLFLLGLVFELAKIHDLADRGHRIGRNLDQIEPRLFGHDQGAFRRDNAHVFAIGADQANI